ncbi:MAG TPA: hypothetical protein VJ976_01510, partial [Ornithinimicrobium sp.]
MSLAVVEPTVGQADLGGSVLDGPLRQMRAGANAALAARPEVVRESDAGLGRAVEGMHVLRADLDRLSVTLVTEAARRGLVQES